MKSRRLRPRLTDDQKREVVDLYKKDWKLGQIKAKFGWHCGKAIKKHLCDLGIYEPGQMYKPLPSEAVIRLMDQGYTHKEIASYFQVPIMHVHRFRGGTWGRRSKRLWALSRRKVKPGSALAKEIIRLRNEERLSFRNIGKRFGLIHLTVYNTYYREAGRVQQRFKAPKARRTDKFIDEIVQLRDVRGWTFTKIGKHLGLSVAKAYYRATGKTRPAAPWRRNHQSEVNCESF